jgi:Flp pilus assembly protein TadG
MRTLASLLHDRSGGVAPLLGIVIIPLMAAVGAAVDYSRATNVRAGLQAALDSTALMMSKDAQELTDAQREERANAVFKALFKKADAQNISLTPKFTELENNRFSFKITGKTTVYTTFARIMGHTHIDIDTSSEVIWGVKRLELALALDNTGSMASDGKMAALKTAAHNLLDTLKKAAKKPEDIKVAIVPFDTTVNIGTEYADQFWIDYSVNDIKKSKWKGCVEDRTQSNDVLDAAPVEGSSATYFPADACGSLAKALPLTNDWTALHSKVDQMAPNGSTNVTIGLVWAWHALTQNSPFPEGSPGQPDLDKVIILLTDGENTKNRWTTSTNSINTRTSAACNNIKAVGIKLYTVRVVEGNAILLQGCATKPDMYYDVQDASQLNGAFNAIAQALANLRISK